MIKHPNRRGRKKFLDDKKQSEICAVMAVGCLISTAAAYVGCVTSTIYLHARKHPEFAEALRQARARSEVVLLTSIREAAVRDKKDWRAAAWLLAHCHGDRYSQRPEGLTAEQLGAALNRFAEVLVSEIADVTERRRVAARLEVLATTLAQDTATAKEIEGTV